MSSTVTSCLSRRRGRWRGCLMPRFFSTGSSTAAGSGTPTAKVTRTRRRHRFGADNLAAIPSLHDFQQQAQTRSLYRKFMRLAYQQQADAAGEFRSQIRTEFRKGTNTAGDTNRALSEGSRRLKEVQAMVGTAKEKQSQAVPSKAEWPWNSGRTSQKPPLQFPPKNTR